ncbi:conserved hypothetical protein [Pyrenophora tritici-repentis Pt-1C-BFP]|uniref:Fe2OG dioxygenase domain-containing protein n=1 Tax=Pyrenophora tritici-repentis (strain Pt-1C-BFP) TaxID=426418 RepID=B2W7P7_PYRTR|nr:uncharacterized protein PTRG_05835 [Pyrenophora tritici-repentis Pt-1C-BFP]EDU48755.1 conserved hypothetical protein [Pyrenophora tritici-repentis Pt-1C-BFP]
MSDMTKIQNSIPVIEISNPSKEVAQQVLDAASKHGFLYIKNDGVTIPPQDIDAMFELTLASKGEENGDDASSEPNTITSIRAGAHSDYGSITLLFRLPGQPGLELLTESGWVPVPVNPDEENLAHPPILVNIGDLLCYWTNGMLKSTVHRVAFEGGEERYSMAYFCHPLDEARLDAVPSKVIEAFGTKGDAELRSQRKRLGLKEDGGDGVITAKGHLERRLKVTYGI